MTRPGSSLPYICARCLRAQGVRRLPKASYRSFSESVNSPLSHSHARPNENASRKGTEVIEEEGAMSRRLSELSERNLEEGGRSAQKTVEEAGFDEELKQKLLDRLADASFRSEHANAFSQAEMPSSAGKGTRDNAAARPWTGNETIEDAALRMLTDARKPIRVPSKIPSPRGPPIKVETGKSKKAPSSGVRLANARDRSSMYSYLKDESLSQKEREQMRKELKERFTPAARPMPTTLQGLASLANERIEDAIARGQFKNLPRGKKIERDYNMSSPFLETTEYFLNKIIQKQDIVPPWIEKQQELTSTALKFRGRLRADWRRHAARLISSQGGPLQTQIQRAEEYAAAEALVNPSRKKEEKVNTVDSGGYLSQITLAGDLRARPGNSETPTETITVTESTPNATSEEPTETITLTVSTPPVDAIATATVSAAETTPLSDAATLDASSPPSTSSTADPVSSNPRIINGAVFPFRDPAWERTEHSYHLLAIKNLNDLTRSYNLMAPNLAKKPYFSLERELRACFADVAPQLAGEIRERALAPKVKVEVVGHREGGVLERFGAGEAAKVYDERRPQYGFKEFWKDMFGKEK